MRFDIIHKAAFFQGLGLGLGLAGVAFFAFEAVRRRRFDAADEHGAYIDGVRPTDTVSLQAQPQAEANATTRRLESEAPDEAVGGERW